MNETELRNAMLAKGFVQSPDGGWCPPRVNPVFHPDSSGSPAKLEPDSRDGALGEVPVQEGVGGQFFIRATSIRKRLLDEDNLCEKYLIDLCRYSGIVPGDSPATTHIQVCQQKAEPGAAEETRIEVFRL